MVAESVLPEELGITMLVDRAGGWLNWHLMPAHMQQRYAIMLQAEGMHLAYIRRGRRPAPTQPWERSTPDLPEVGGLLDVFNMVPA